LTQVKDRARQMLGGRSSQDDADHLDCALDTKLAHDVGAMILDCLGTDSENPAYLLASAASMTSRCAAAVLLACRSFFRQTISPLTLRQRCRGYRTGARFATGNRRQRTSKQSSRFAGNVKFACTTMAPVV